MTSIAACSASTIASIAVARRRYRCASCSQVNPIPPCTWMLSWALRSAAGTASVAAMAAVQLNWSPPPVPARPASHPAAVASSVATSMLAQWCLTAWNMAIGRPNCSRTFAYSAACSVHSRRCRSPPPRGSCGPGRSAARARPAAPGRGRVEADPGRAPGRVEVRGHLDLDAAGRFSITSTSSPAGTSSTSARWPLSTTPACPVAVPPAGPSATSRRRRARPRRSRCRRPGRAAAACAGRRARPRRSPRWRSRSARTAGCEVPAQLLDHDERLRQPEARAAELLGHVQPEPAEVAELVPEGGQRLGPGLEQAARRRAGLVLGQEVGDGLARARWSSVMAIDMDK